MGHVRTEADPTGRRRRTLALAAGGVNRQPRTPADWLAALKASGWKGRKSGREVVGPCPLCGGTDRFHVGPGRKVPVLAGCRHGCRFEDLAEAVFGRRTGDREAFRPWDWTQDPRNGRNAASGAENGEFEAIGRPYGAKLEAGKGRIPPVSGASRAARLWARGVPVPLDPAHPARRWAARRHLWPDRKPWPDAVRWLASSDGGSLVACFAPLAEWTGPQPPAPAGVQCVHVDPEGRPRTDGGGLAKRSHGRMTGAVCVFGAPPHLAGRIHVTEGMADALAVAARTEGAVLATGGTSGFGRLAETLCAPVTLWPDGDGPGREAADGLARRLSARRLAVHVAPVPDGEDPASMAGPLNTWKEGDMTEPQTFNPDPPDPDGDAESMAKRREALAAAKEAIRRGEYDRARRDLDAMAQADRAAVDPLADLDGAHTIEALRAVLDRVARPPALTAPSFDADLPLPVLWPGGEDPGRGVLLGAGEVAILSGPGGGGKSSVALAVAHAAAHGGEACGLAVAPGRVALASYEDSPARLEDRMEWHGPADTWAHVRTSPAPAPLWTADPDTGAAGPSPWWATWWDAVADFRPVLVVVDPASVAFAGANPSDGAAVRAFLAAVSGKAARIGCGVLIVAHDTKGSRNEQRAGSGPGPGAVSGSAQWTDGARGVLHLSGERTDGRRLLVCEKSNYGPTGWGARLAPRWADGKWRGLRFEKRLNHAEVATARKEWANPTAPKGNGRTAGEDWRRTAQR